MNTLTQLAAGQLMDEEGKASGQMRNTGKIGFNSAWCAVALLCAVGVTGCSSNYVVRTVDGKTYNTQGAPELSDGSYKFIDSTGQAQRLQLSQVSAVQKP